MSRQLLLNAVIFQLGWFVCVLYGTSAALSYALLTLTLHFVLIVEKHWRLAELLLIIAVVAAGWATDTLLLASGLLILPDAYFLPPPWLLAIWLLFACTLRHCLAWLQRSYTLTALLGAVVGPLNYLAGARLAGGAVAEPLAFSVLMLMLLWLLLLPLLVFLAQAAAAFVKPGVATAWSHGSHSGGG